ncbi:MAG: hypothetical protein ABSE85_13260 [Candidatus Korobacteraceae bacterium]
MTRDLAAGLSELEAARSQYGLGCAARVERVLASLRGQTFADAESLIAFHDALLFLRAFPQSRKVVILTEALLCRVGQQVKMLRDSGADLDLFDSEEFSGIAGTAIRDTFTYEVARWLALRFASELRVDWDLDEQSRQMSSSLPQQLPLLADDCLVEADTPYLEWLSSAAGGVDRILSWLMQRLESSPRNILEKTAWYDALKIDVEWELGESAASRTHARRDPPDPYCHVGPLIRRNQVSLEEELDSPPLPVRKLSRSEGEQVMDLVRTVLTVRYRELYGTTRGDAEHVVEADVGRGVHIFLWGLPPERRLPLRAYYAGMTVKNGVPINYIEGIGLFEWMEVGFNTFYAFRDGETAWIYSKVLHLLHQLAGITCFSVYPYQIGQDNEEAIKSGAFWFYRKLGFRPGKPELLALTEREEARIAKTPGYRTQARTLRKLAAEHVFYEFGEGPRGLWDEFSIRNIGFAVERYMAEKFKGDPGKMREAAVASLARELGTDLRKWSSVEQVAFADFALVLALVPEVKGWSSREKKSLAEIIRAKVGASEAEYLRLMQGHVKLKRAMVRLGSVE